RGSRPARELPAPRRPRGARPHLSGRLRGWLRPASAARYGELVEVVAPASVVEVVLPPLGPVDTMISTVEPCRSGVPPAGSWEITTPEGTEPDEAKVTCGTKPALESRCSAVAWVRFTTSGTSASSGGTGP